ncbi:MAG: antitoxin [bacterium (Candidatus Stahlbacteria) CG23_combo_of_CG06-09_8_20_14_all_40_9]|nr:MAG: antitoxin [bacterium (Candidatus Stahlbacteria) CG23_combo_of_CG06-09_8_20_14_all_40_9]
MNERIVSEPNICGGEPCIRGTRIPVHIILSHLATGEDYDTILKNFPNIEKEDILACLEYGSYLATEKTVKP